MTHGAIAVTTGRRWFIAIAASAVLVLARGGAATEEKEPVYVGARACAACHEGKAAGSQFSRWLLSKHSKAWAALSKPEAAAIAKLSGVPGDPKRSQNCLGCHATASDEEPWRRDPTFAIEDGIQCERCHGPGSEYMDESVMRYREAAMKAGLRIMTKRDCELCHYVKGSHVAVHHRPQLDIDKALQSIAHPKPGPTPPAFPPPPAAAADAIRSPKFAGARTCGRCHDRPEQRCRFSRWRMSPHAEAYAVLSTPEADRIADGSGVSGDPQRSRDCLRCHATGGGSPVQSMPAFSTDEGVGCEACHGPGGDYMTESVMRDGAAARAAGLKSIDRDTCLACHAGGHGKAFDADAALSAMRSSAATVTAVEAPRYKTPLNLAIRPDGAEIYVACEASDSVVVVDAVSRKKLAEIAVGGQPADVAFSPDGRRAFVSNRLDDTVSVIDVPSRDVVRTVSVGDEPHGLVTDASGGRLFVLNTASNNVSVIDTATFEPIKVLAASRGPWSIALSPDGSRLLVTNYLSRFVPFRTESISELTSIDVAGARAIDRTSVPGANLMLGVAWHPAGEFALATLNRTKNAVPMTRILQGWAITNGLAVLWKDGRVDQVLLDEPGLYFADATDVVFTPDGRLALVTSAGSDRVAVVAVDRLVGMLRSASDHDREHEIPNHLGRSYDFVLKRIPTRDSPRGIAISPDGRTAFVANALDDSLTAIDLAGFEAVDRVDLGGPREITTTRRGEALFNSARVSFQRQFSCHSCHPDGHVDGLTYDIEADGIGFNPVDNRTLRGIVDTDPFKWAGTNPSLARQCGPRLAVFFTRAAPFTPDELYALTTYVSTIPRPPNRYRPVGAELNPAQRRGKAIFERTRTNDGREIPMNNRCDTCHNPPLYTDRSKRNVGTMLALDEHEEIDVPHLNNIYDSAPYLHDGIAPTLEEIWTRYNPRDEHGVTNDLTKDQLNDLIEYLRTL